MSRKNIYDDGSQDRDRKIRREGRITVLLIFLVLGLFLYLIIHAKKDPTFANKLVHYLPFLKTFFTDGNGTSVTTGLISMLYLI